MPLPCPAPKPGVQNSQMGTALQPILGWESSGVWPGEGGNALGGAWVCYDLGWSFVSLPRSDVTYHHIIPYHISYYLILYHLEHIIEWSGLGMHTQAELHPCWTRDLFIPHLSCNTATTPLCLFPFPSFPSSSYTSIKHNKPSSLNWNP